MQKSLLILWLLACSTAPAFAQPDSHPLVSRLISLYKKLERLDIRYRDFHEERYADSVAKYNTRFSKLITSPGMTSLTPADWKQLTSSTGLQITTSGDGQLQIVSWSLENPYPTPSYCSDVVFARSRKPLPVSIFGGAEDDAGDNVTTDTIIDIRLKGNAYYLVFGSNKCGALCEVEQASIYSLTDKEIIRCDSAFYDDSVYTADVSFSYRYSDGLKFDPAFSVIGNVLTCPVFDEDGQKQIGTKRYTLTPTTR